MSSIKYKLSVYNSGYIGSASPLCQKHKNVSYEMEHILVAERVLKRKLYKHEVVHHLDGNQAHNNWRNLLVLRESQHLKLHAWLKRNGIRLKKIDTSNKKQLLTYTKRCKTCNFPLYAKKAITYCSLECAKQRASRYIQGSTKLKPNKKQLARLIAKNYSWVRIGRMFNVSDSAVRKWAKGYKLR